MLTLPAGTAWMWIIPFLIAAGVSLLCTPLAIRLARRFSIMDRPVGLKLHKVATPLLGGVGVYLAFLVTSILFLPLEGPVLGILLGGAVAVAVGVIDDRFTLPPLVHLAGQMIAAIVAVVSGLGVIRNISIPWEAPDVQAGLTNYHGSWQIPTLIGVIITLFWIVGLMNTVNFLDGLDGLSSGVALIASVLLALWAAYPPTYIPGSAPSLHHADFILPMVLVGALAGFLPYNWHPAKVFIGDSGAMFLGLALASLSILGIVKIGTALLVLSIPVLDVAWAIVRRQLKGRSFLAGDKQHVYHRMVELGMSQTATVLSLYALCIVLAVVDLSAHKLAKLVAFAIVVVLTGTAFVILEVVGNRRKDVRSISKPATESAS